MLPAPSEELLRHAGSVAGAGELAGAMLSIAFELPIGLRSGVLASGRMLHGISRGVARLLVGPLLRH
jgi:hypothetical protein